MKHEMEKHEAGPERISQRELKRDPVFCRDLAREWGMEAAPESYRKALEGMYAELPDELPVKRYPLRSALRGLTVTAAALLLACASLLGVNAMNPELMESLPGIGEVFRAVNGTKKTPPPEDLPVVVPGPEESEPPGPSSMPEAETTEFTPVAAQGSEGLVLTVADAWSDGIYLHLEMQLECGDSDLGKKALIGPCRNPNMQIDTSVVEADGRAAGKVNPQLQDVFFKKNGDTEVHLASWVMELPEKLSERKDVAVRLSVPDLSAVFEAQDTVDGCHISSGLELEFTVTADPAYNVQITEPVTDNGVTLLSVDSTPSRLLAELKIPFLGRIDYSLLNEMAAMGIADGREDSERPTPLGRYAVLRDMDGQRLETGLRYSGDEEQFDFTVVDPLGEERPYYGVDDFGGPTRGTKQVVLTLYEYPLSITQGGMAPGTPDSELLGNNRVAAEFTIDLEQGTAYPSQQYLQDGLEKLNSETCRQETHTVDSPSGYYPNRPCLCEGYGPEGACEQIFFTEKKEYRPVELRCYSGDELVQVLKSHSESEYNYAEEGNTGFTRYEDEHGQYWETVTDPRYTQKEYRKLNFVVYYPEGTTRDGYGFSADSFSRMDLVDSETGEVLIEDEARTFWRNYDQKFGTDWETGLFEGYPISQEESEAQFYQGESSAAGKAESGPAPRPTPEPAENVPSSQVIS